MWTTHSTVIKSACVEFFLISRLVPPPGELDKTYALPLIWAYSLHDMKTSSASDLSMLEFVRYTSFVIIIIINKKSLAAAGLSVTDTNRPVSVALQCSRHNSTKAVTIQQ